MGWKHLYRGVDDRVQTTQPMAGLPRGSIGTIRHRFTRGDFCDVRFDGKLLPRLVHCSALEHMAALERSVGTPLAGSHAAVVMARFVHCCAL